ncbi:hypothetical protein [Nocardia gamkensis]|uniref:Uncharacterized protein n=1 Tax=Nocardia gamkensis TaxID=352869 RepID=A0A7X6R3Z7_9NOCA|nr:hypothetical protein [Nocardia gamkensis]NKY27787.1 hypothetical protein [Nocardia gamkensis]
MARQTFHGFVISEDRMLRGEALHYIPDKLAKLDRDYALKLLGILCQDHDADIAAVARDYYDELMQTLPPER